MGSSGDGVDGVNRDEDTYARRVKRTTRTNKGKVSERLTWLTQESNPQTNPISLKSDAVRADRNNWTRICVLY